MKQFKPLLIALFWTGAGLGAEGGGTVKVVNFASDLPCVSSLSESFDPDSYSLISQVHDALIHCDLDGNFIPGLATSWKQLDPTTYRFSLRKNVSFHDGSPFTAKDVKFTYETITAPESKSGTKWVLDTIQEVRVLDDYTAEIATRIPDGMFLHRIGMFGAISSKAYVERVGRDKALKHPVGTGPFAYAEHIPGERYVLKANPDYWREGIPAYERLIFELIPEDQWAQALQDGRVDLVTNLSGKKALQVMKSPALDLKKRLVLQSYWVLLNNEGPLADLRVRKALNLAVDRDSLIRFGDGGNGAPQASLGKMGEFGYNETLTPYPYDAAQAKTLLEEAGYGQGFSLDMLAADVAANVAKVICKQLNPVGVQVNLTVVSRPEWAKTVVVGKVTGTPYQGDMAVNLVDNPIYNQAFHSGLFLASQSPWSLLDSPEFDEKYENALMAGDAAEHERRLKELDSYIHGNALLLFTYQRIKTVGYNKKLTLPGISANGHVDFLMLSDIRLSDQGA